MTEHYTRRLVDDRLLGMIESERHRADDFELSTWKTHLALVEIAQLDGKDSALSAAAIARAALEGTTLYGQDAATLSPPFLDLFRKTIADHEAKQAARRAT